MKKATCGIKYGQRFAKQHGRSKTDNIFDLVLPPGAWGEKKRKRKSLCV